MDTDQSPSLPTFRINHLRDEKSPLWDRKDPWGPSLAQPSLWGRFREKHRWLYSLGSLVFASHPLFIIFLFLKMPVLSISVLMISSKPGNLKCSWSQALKHPLYMIMTVVRLTVSILENAQVPGAVPSSAGPLSHCIFITTACGKCYRYPHMADEKTKAYRAK